MSQKESEPYVPPPSRSNGIGASDNGLAEQDTTTRERIRRPGPWTAVRSHIAKDRNYMRCSLPARHMHLIAWLYCNRERTDGNLGQADFRNVAAESQLSEADAESAAVELVAAGLWQPGYELVDFLKWNLSAAQIRIRADDNAERQRVFRKKGFSDPSKETEHTEIQNTQNTQVRNQLRNALQDQDGLTETPEAIQQRQATAQRLREISEEKLGRNGNVAVQEVVP